jgi:TonB family protein
MSAMVRRVLSAAFVAGTLSLAIPSFSVCAQGQDVNQYLRDQYRGKTFVLRGFPTDDVLHYDASGASDSSASGDWTIDGFVQVNDIHMSDDRLTIKAQRMVAARLDKDHFELRPLERAKGNITRKEFVRVEIKADAGMHNPSQDQIDALVSRIFLTAQDSLGDLVPDYWKSCVRAGLKGTDKNCAFAPEVLAIPGVGTGTSDGLEGAATADERSGGGSAFKVGKDMRPPRVTYQHEPEFSDAARVAKFQGTVLLSLTVNKEGDPTNIRISQPLGYGLDAKAVEAVEGWKFTPAEKDGEPLDTRIAVEVSFHLY